jgi:hypothetical protein
MSDVDEATAREVATIKNIIKAKGLPSGIRNFRIQLDEDWTGEPYFLVWLIADDPDSSDETALQTSSEFARAVMSAVWDAGLSRWASVRFASVEEESSLPAGL